MPSWFSKTPIKIRDDGAVADPGHPGDRDEHGNFIMEPHPLTGELRPRNFKPETPERNAWPEGSCVLIKPRVTGNDILKMQNLQMTASVSGSATDPQLHAQLGINHEAIVYAITFVVGLEGEVFSDEDGKPLKVPAMDELEERAEFFGDFPNAVLWFIRNEVAKRSNDPLPLTTSVSDTSGRSGRSKTKTQQ